MKKNTTVHRILTLLLTLSLVLGAVAVTSSAASLPEQIIPTTPEDVGTCVALYNAAAEVIIGFKEGTEMADSITIEPATVSGTELRAGYSNAGTLYVVDNKDGTYAFFDQYDYDNYENSYYIATDGYDTFYTDDIENNSASFTLEEVEGGYLIKNVADGTYLAIENDHVAVKALEADNSLFIFQFAIFDRIDGMSASEADIVCTLLSQADETEVLPDPIIKVGDDVLADGDSFTFTDSITVRIDPNTTDKDVVTIYTTDEGNSEAQYTGPLTFIETTELWVSNIKGENQGGIVKVSLVKEPGEEPSITVTPKEKNVVRGGALDLDATVTGLADTGVAWSIIGAYADGTSIDKDGVLTVAANEPANRVVVEAQATGVTAGNEHSVLFWVYVTDPTTPTATGAEPTATGATPTATGATPTATGVVLLYGDANGDNLVNMKDVLVIRKHLAGLSVSINTQSADANADGQVNMKDVLLVRKFLAGLVSEGGLGPQG